MTTTNAVTLAREVLDAHAAWGKTAPGTEECTRAHEVFDDAANRNASALARAVLAVAQLHEPIRVYLECEEPECENDHIELMDYQGCQNTVIGWACPICCYADEHPLECEDHLGDHTGVPQKRACTTRTALNGETP